jgi:hypothetical protein
MRRISYAKSFSKWSAGALVKIKKHLESVPHAQMLAFLFEAVNHARRRCNSQVSKNHHGHLDSEVSGGWM